MTEVYLTALAHSGWNDVKEAIGSGNMCVVELVPEKELREHSAFDIFNRVEGNVFDFHVGDPRWRHVFNGKVLCS